MNRLPFQLMRLVMLGLMLAFAAVQPAAAQSVLRDSETELMFREMSRPLIQAAGLDPANVKIVLINDDEINAFVAGGQIVYIHSGLLTRADNANQVQGVIAHELGHVAGGHVIRIGEGAKVATGITLLSLVLGAAAIAAGAPDAGMGIIMAGQRAAMGNFFAFTRARNHLAITYPLNSYGSRRGADYSIDQMSRFLDRGVRDQMQRVVPKWDDAVAPADTEPTVAVDLRALMRNRFK